MSALALGFKVSRTDVVVITIVGVVALAGAYYIAKYGLDALGGVFSGNNKLTKDTPYEGAGVAGTLGAATNNVLGGAPQAVGESIGSGLFSLFNPSADSLASSVTYIVKFPDGAKHAVDSSNVDGSGQFTYAGLRFQLGIVNGSKVATQVYSSGYSTAPNDFGVTPGQDLGAGGWG